MPKKQIILWGLISRQPRWGLTIKGWLGILSAIALGFWLLLFRLQPFLAYTNSIDPAELLIVEGWIGDDGIIGAIAEFERKPYQLLITAGSHFGRGEYLSQYKDFAHLTEATLVTLGFDPQKIQAIPTPLTKRERTLTAALEVKRWLVQNNLNFKATNVYSEDVHSRRSWLLYSQVLEPEMKVGIIAHPPSDYDPQTWWTSSEGFKEVVTEALAYIYAKFF